MCQPNTSNEISNVNLHITNITTSREKRIPYACIHLNDAWCCRPSSDVIHHSPWRLHLDSWQRRTWTLPTWIFDSKVDRLGFVFVWWVQSKVATPPPLEFGRATCQTLAKSLTDAGRGVFDVKGLVWYGGNWLRGGGKFCSVMNRQWVHCIYKDCLLYRTDRHFCFRRP